MIPIRARACTRRIDVAKTRVRWSVAALLALVGFHSVSAEFQVHAIGYMTNAFAQPMSVLALAALTIAAPVIASV